ncbi:uncharacterized protein LOC126320472 [Schistocerca gregaria]|uniref:uncharacterized protein LOC126320472 n=1 Tax=Schistocerca gregaria TaxID=7010 RepID=UPI00211DF1A5|nr:uncharacterized protein LOC126320472 [Schistocerca gregaria]
MHPSMSAPAEFAVSKKKYSILLPTYNERKNLPILVWLMMEYLKELAHPWEIVIIDDSSPDDTLEAAQQLQAIYGKEKVVVCSRPAKLGLGTAYLYGFRHSTGDFIICMDADFYHHPKYIPQLIKKQFERNAHIVIGSRYLPGAGIHEWSRKRRLISFTANYISRTFVLGSNVSDLTNAYRMYQRSAFATLIGMCTSKGYSFQTEIILKAADLNLIIDEIPIRCIDRVYGTSKLSLGDIKEYVSLLITAFLNIKSSTHGNCSVPT